MLQTYMIKLSSDRQITSADTNQQLYSWTTFISNIQIWQGSVETDLREDFILLSSTVELKIQE